MNRLTVLGLATVFCAGACGGERAAPAPEQPDGPPAAAAPDPTMLPTPQQNAAGAFSVACGGQPYSVAFTDFAATLTYDDGATAELPQQPATADTEPGVTVYSNGQVSFAKSGEGASSVIRFARARMPWKDCVIAQN
ncbi:MAG: hypothetical protein B7Y90_09460 [Alphaproteobacteria bacterium 32-64-14]|nr:MAG: hypothetical protein B7Y90_09460 [Alphaproteobacteria bacterium 32-64-14]